MWLAVSRGAGRRVAERLDVLVGRVSRLVGRSERWTRDSTSVKQRSGRRVCGGCRQSPRVQGAHMLVTPTTEMAHAVMRTQIHIIHTYSVHNNLFCTQQLILYTTTYSVHNNLFCTQQLILYTTHHTPTHPKRSPPNPTGRLTFFPSTYGRIAMALYSLPMPFGPRSTSLFHPISSRFRVSSSFACFSSRSARSLMPMVARKND